MVYSNDQVSVHCVEVFPCGYWKCLISHGEAQSGTVSTGFEKNTWPPISNIMCWHCCHPFNCVPVYYPLKLDIKSNTFYFIGNFCSWNCVKAYGVRMNGHRRPEGASWISLLAFLTVHRPMYCSQSILERHSFDCPCIDKFYGIPVAPPKETLKIFGGDVSIDDYRKDFLQVKKYDWVVQYFHQNNKVTRDLETLTSTQKRRAYTFCFIAYPGPRETKVNELYILPLTHKTVPKRKQSTTVEEEPKKILKSCSRPNPTGRRRLPKSNAPVPTSTFTPKDEDTKQLLTNTTRVDTCIPVAPRKVEPVVSEEQAFYISSVNKFGNLMSSMGIVIEKKSSLDGSC